jgi:hypothetical protein
LFRKCRSCALLKIVMSEKMYVFFFIFVQSVYFKYSIRFQDKGHENLKS